MVSKERAHEKTKRRFRRPVLNALARCNKKRQGRYKLHNRAMCTLHMQDDITEQRVVTFDEKVQNFLLVKWADIFWAFMKRLVKAHWFQDSGN